MALGVALSLVGCSSSPRPVLKLASAGGTAGAQIPNVASRTPFLFRTYNVCSARGAVKLTGVTLTKPTGGLQVVDWGVNAQDSGIGAAPGTVSSLGGYTHGPVTAPCTAPTFGVVLDVSVRGSASVASATSFVVHYQHGQVVVPFAVMICTATCPPRKN
jgi:cytochrome c biogenesis protein CcdA